MASYNPGDTKGYGRTTTDPASGGIAITPHNSTNLTYVTRAVYVGGSGNLVAVMQDGTVLTFVGVLAGTVLPIRVRRINSTNTTATNIIGLY